MRHRLIWALAALAAASPAGAAPQRPAADPQRYCFDGGEPYPVGAHLCQSANIVSICLRRDQTYGVQGIYVYKTANNGPGLFDKAHWIETTSPRCGPGAHGKVYFTNDPKH